jgi:RNA polymerase sigma factor for flagellar operon FliA
MNAASILPALLPRPSAAPTVIPPSCSSIRPFPTVHITSVPAAAPHPTLPPRVRAERMLKMVRRVAASFARCRPAHFDVDELVGAGALGLADAFSRRNGMPGSEFEAFALHRIRGAMLDELRRRDVMSRKGRASSNRIARARRAVEQRLGTAARAEEVAAELGLRPSLYHELCAGLATQHEPVSLSATVDGEERTDYEIPDSGAAPDEASVRANMAEIATKLIETLPARTRRILLAIHVEGMTLKQIGAEIGVTESRVSQIYSAAVAALRANLCPDSGKCERKIPVPTTLA